MRVETEIRARICAFAAVAFFLLSAVPFLGILGIEADEALPVEPLFRPKYWYYALHLGHARIPLMHMAYLGTLKTWLWAPIFHWWGATAWTLRFPAVLAGAASIWIFYLFLRAAAGARAAALGCAILAADSQYLLTTTFDWGPVALQHLLILAGLLLLVRFHGSRSAPWLAAAFFLFGLAVWDKMLGVWMLSGLAAGAVAAVPRQIARVWNWRRTAIAAAAFFAGALPVAISGIHDHFAALRENAGRTTQELPQKVAVLENTLDGSGLFGYMFAEDSETSAPHAASGLMERASAEVSRCFGHPRRSLELYAFLLALALVPLARGRDLRAIRFSLVAMAVAWVQMATTAGAGGSVHHVILMWPLPAMVAGVSFAAASRRLGYAGIPAIAAILAVLVLSEALVTNEYLWKSVRNGGGRTWSDAIFPLSIDLSARHAAAVYCADWDTLENLRFLGHGSLPLESAMDPLPSAGMSANLRQWLLKRIAAPDGVWVTHVPDMEFFRDIRPKWDDFAAAAGFDRRVVEVVRDTHGRPTFEIYRFEHREQR